jgi:hypothetical protein
LAALAVGRGWLMISLATPAIHGDNAAGRRTRNVSDQWYYRKGGETRGPVSRQELDQLARAGEIDPKALVWREGFPDWVSLAATGASGSAAVPPPPPPPPPQVSAPPHPSAALRSARRPPSDSTGWIVMAGVGLVALLLAAVAIGWVARGYTSTPRGSLNVAAKAGNSPVQPATKANRPTNPSPRTDAVRNPTPVTRPAAEETVTVPARPGVVELPPPAANPSTSEPPASAQPSVTPPSTAPSQAAPPADNASPPPPAASGQGSSAGKLETLFQEVDVQRNPTFAILGTETTQNLHYQMLSELRVGQPDERGNRKVDQTVKNARLINADDLSRAMFEESLRKLVGWQFSYRLNAGGEVTELKSGPADGRRAAAVEPKGATGFLLTSVMDEAGWKELAQLSFFVPDQQARDNQPWLRQMTHDFGPLGSWSGTTQFRRQGTQKGILRIDYVHEMTYKPPEKGAGDLPFAVADAKFVPDVAGGSIYIDTKTGRVQAAQDRFQVRGEISSEVLGQAATIQVQEQQAITVRIFDQDPWSQNGGAAGSRQRTP